MFKRSLCLARPRLLLILALASAGLIGGCSEEDPPKPGDARQELVANRLIWESAGLKDYDLRLERSCFCPPEVTEPLDIRVADGEVATAWRDPGHKEVATTLGMTVEDLFDRVESALDDETATIDVSYNRTFGYPEEVSLNWPGVADGFWGASAELLCRRAGEDTTVACDCAGDARTARYSFTAKDAGGVVIATGCLGLVFTESPSLSVPEAVSGRRCLRGTCALDVPGAFPGEWNVSGSVNQFGLITLDLNSGAADFNIFLAGRFEAAGAEHGDFTGEWDFSTIVGPQARGSFTAVRQP